MRDVLIGGLLLPLHIYLQPSAFREEIAALAPDLPEYYSLLHARHKLRDTVFRQGLGRFLWPSAVSLIWGPVLTALVLGLFAALGYDVDWAWAAGGVAVGVAVGVTGGVAVGVAGSVAVGVA
jgi:hypothetical protein